MKQLASLVALLALGTPALAEDAAPRIDGHRAIYEIGFGSARNDAGVIGATGRYVFDLADTCDGYALNERLVVELARASDGVLTDYRLSAYESADGGSYRFSTQTDFDGETGQSAEGALTLEDGRTEVEYASEERLAYDEPVLTPVAHVRAVLAEALAGGERHAAMIFDGDRETPVFYAVTRIRADDAEAAPSDAEGGWRLRDLRRWRIDSAYYPPEADGEAAVPRFAFAAVLYENGIVDDLVLDYQDFALKARMSELELHDGGC